MQLILSDTLLTQEKLQKFLLSYIKMILKQYLLFKMVYVGQMYIIWSNLYQYCLHYIVYIDQLIDHMIVYTICTI